MTPVSLRRYDDYWALRPEDRSEDGSAYGGIPPPGAGIRLDSRRWAALRASGWRIVTPSARVAQKLAEGELPSGAGDALQVWRGAGARPVLVTWRLTVTFRPGVGADAGRTLLREAGFEPVRRLPWLDAGFTVRIPRTESPFGFAERVEGSLAGQVRRARPEILVCWSNLGPSSSVVVHDARQWQWPRIQADRAWWWTRGKGVRIAVIDGGFRNPKDDTIHPNLLEAVLPSSGNFPSTGDILFELGPAKLLPDTTNHGTPCAGLAAARRTDRAELIGAAPEAELMLLSIDPCCSPETLAWAITYATDPGSLDGALPGSDARADVLSCSLLPTEEADSEADLEAICEEIRDHVLPSLEKAWTSGREKRGMPVFWAASNNENEKEEENPIATSEHTIVVGRTDEADVYAGHSGVGLDLVAPGYLVYTTGWTVGGPGMEADGASFAAPIAAGVAALILSRSPDRTADEVRRRLLDSCDKVPGDATTPAVYDDEGRAPHYGHGRVNACRALAPGCRLCVLFLLPRVGAWIRSLLAGGRRSRAGPSGRRGGAGLGAPRRRCRAGWGIAPRSSPGRRRGGRGTQDPSVPPGSLGGEAG